MKDKEALKLALEALEHEADIGNDNAYKLERDAIKEALAQPEHEKERCVGCEACIDTACGRDECPNGWPKAAQPEQEQSGFFSREAMKAHSDFHVAQPEQDKERCVGCEACIDTACGRDECPKGWPKASQPEQQPVAMKFKIYKPTVPDPMRQGINNALLPWVYDQDRSSGFDASMWVTPVATLPPQRTWVGLTDEDIRQCSRDVVAGGKENSVDRFAYAIEAKLKEKNT